MGINLLDRLGALSFSGKIGNREYWTEAREADGDVIFSIHVDGECYFEERFPGRGNHGFNQLVASVHERGYTEEEPSVFDVFDEVENKICDLFDPAE